MIGPGSDKKDQHFPQFGGQTVPNWNQLQMTCSNNAFPGNLSGIYIWKHITKKVEKCLHPQPGVFNQQY